MKPIVAIVGRPNVGKSSLFNRITRSRSALVDDVPGVTRDRNYGDGEWDGVAFTLVDTGGFIAGDRDDFAEQIYFQVCQAIEHADALILILDGKSGPSPFDSDLVRQVEHAGKPVFYAVNKIDNMEQEDRLYEFYGLGIERLYPVSAAHGYGVSDLLDDLVSRLPQMPAPEPSEMIRVAVVGRPNAGKSSLINRILGDDRLVVSAVPGTTRDAVDSVCQMGGRSYLLIDTAGIRRKARVSGRLEKFSVIKALKSLDRCDVALVVMDAYEGITDQDITIAGYAHERGCACIFLLNKWDIVEKDRNTAKRYYEQLRVAAKFMSFAPALTISALTGLRMARIFDMIDEVYRQYATRISTGELNRILERATARKEASLHRGRRIKFYYAAQVSAKPPTIVVFVNYPQAVHFSYRRYLINQIRSEAGLERTPLRVILRERQDRRTFGRKRKKGKQG